MKNNRQKLSVVLATKNEEENISRCLDSVKEIANEIIIVDEYSEDDTVKIAEKYNAKIYQRNWEKNFHENKQFGIEKATEDWILQLDADEVVTTELAEEMVEVINSTNDELKARVIGHPGDRRSIGSQAGQVDSIASLQNDKNVRLFKKYQSLIEQRDGRVGAKKGDVVAFFIPRKNIFLGAPMVHGGVYPDAVIRLLKKGKAHLPGKSVHELMEVDGQVGWLFNDLLHYDSPTFERYFSRWNRYTDLIAADLEKDKLPVNYFYLAYYSTFKPAFEFLNLYIRHKGVLDGFRGFVWSLFSALRFPVSYFKYWQTMKN